MCWNANVSLNTFLFSVFAITFAYFNGYNPHLLIVFFFFVTIQLNEYFLWKNLKNPEWNRFFTRLLQMNIFIQPFVLTYLVSNPRIRNIYLIALVFYSAVALGIGKIKHLTVKNTTKANNGHLAWNWMRDYLFLWPFYLFFYSVLLVEKLYMIFFIAFVTFAFSFYSYMKDETFGSMWCWTANSISIYLILKILLQCPIW